jgi:hypothetical protein
MREKKMNVKLAIAPIGWTNDDLPELFPPGGEGRNMTSLQGFAFLRKLFIKYFGGYYERSRKKSPSHNDSYEPHGILERFMFRGGTELCH